MFMSRRPNARKVITWWNIESIQEAMIPHYEQMLIKNTTNLDIVFIKNNTLRENTDFTIEFENISLDQYDKMTHMTFLVYVLFGTAIFIFFCGLYGKRILTQRKKTNEEGEKFYGKEDDDSFSL